MSLDLPSSCLIAALTLGVCVEGLARVFRLWTYRSPLFRLANIVGMFGLVEGFGVGWLVGGREALRGVFPVLFMVGAVLGILAEGLNQFWLKAWSWSDRPLLGISRGIDKAAFVGVSWGLAPLLTVVMARVLLSISQGA